MLNVQTFPSGLTLINNKFINSCKYIVARVFGNLTSFQKIQFQKKNSNNILFIWLCKYSDTPHRLYAGVGGQFQNCNHFKKCIIYRNFCSFYILIMFQQNKMLLYYRLVAKYSANVDLTRQTGT